jgi:hypothetical protein
MRGFDHYFILVPRMATAIFWTSAEVTPSAAVISAVIISAVVISAIILLFFEQTISAVIILAKNSVEQKRFSVHVPVYAVFALPLERHITYI